MARRALSRVGSAVVSLAVLAPAAASAEPPPYARRGSVVIGSDTTLLAASEVPRNEPYYAYRNERRNILSLRAVLDAFPIDRLSLGGAATIAHERSDAIPRREATTVSLTARLGYLLGARSFAIWPGVSAGVVYRDTTAISFGADLRAVFSLTDTILFSIGPRIDLEVGRPARERTASLVVGLAGATRTDEITEIRPRGQFGRREMRVVDAQFSATSRANGASGFASTRAAFGLDGFLWPGASIGSYLGVQSHNTGAARVNAFVAGARIGQAIIFSDRLWWWARFGLEVSRADAAGSSPRSVFQIIVDAPFVVAIASGVGIGFGPWLAMPVVGAHVRTTSVGAASSMVFYFL
jgi:hypothetical protein